MTTEAVEGLIEGDNFLELPTQHVGGEQELTLDARFQATLGGVALEDVRREDEHRLRARIPAGLAPGWHPLSVVGPGGRRVELPRAYYASARPLASLEARSGWARPRLWVGERARLELEVENPGTTAALAVTAVLRPEDATRMTILSEPPPVDLPPGASTTLAWELLAEAPGEPRFAVDLQGREEVVGVALEKVGLGVAPLQVRAREAAPLTTTLDATPRTLRVGELVRLSLRVTNTGTRPVLQVVPGLPMVLSGNPLVWKTGPTPARADLPPGGTRDFEWTAVATSGGPVSFQVGATGVDEFLGEAVGAPEALSPEVSVRLPPALTAHFESVPRSVRVDQAFDVVLRVSNTGDEAVKNVRLDDAGIHGTCRLDVVSGPSPASLELGPREDGLFQARLKGRMPGACTLRSGARGTDAREGQPVTAPPEDSPLDITLR